MAFVAGAAGIAGAIVGHGYAERSRQAQRLDEAEQAAALRAALGLRAAEALQLRHQLDAAAAELAVEQAARGELERELAKAQDALGEAHDQLAFYELLVPPGPQGALDVRAFELEHADGALRYRVLLTRYTRRDAAFVGRLQFVASGVSRGQPVTVALAPMRVEADGGGASSGDGNGNGGVDSSGNGNDDLLAVQFTRYQRSQGMLTLPDDFEPLSLTVRVLEGDAVRASRTREMPVVP